jgi:hypothetical protein
MLTSMMNPKGKRKTASGAMDAGEVIYFFMFSGIMIA